MAALLPNICRLSPEVTELPFPVSGPSTWLEKKTSINDLRKKGDHLSYLKAAISLNYDTTSNLIELTDPIAKERPVY